jgi:hypothetical protein
MKKNNQKPIEIDAHFKYRCPKSNCGYDHWLSLKETQTKNFKIVCDCGNIFKPKKITKIKIVYEANSVKTQQQESVVKNESVVQSYEIPVDTENKCVKILAKYGFTHSESVELINKGYLKNPTNDATALIRYIIKNLGDLNGFN